MDYIRILCEYRMTSTLICISEDPQMCLNKCSIDRTTEVIPSNPGLIINAQIQVSDY